MEPPRTSSAYGTQESHLNSVEGWELQFVVVLASGLVTAMFMPANRLIDLYL